MLLTRPPLNLRPKSQVPLDLHVLSVPPAFILSQDQTLVKIFLELLKYQVLTLVCILYLPVVTLFFVLLKAFSRNNS